MKGTQDSPDAEFCKALRTTRLCVQGGRQWGTCWNPFLPSSYPSGLFYAELSRAGLAFP